MSNELKPVAYQKRWYDNDKNTVTYQQWYQWENCTEQDHSDVNSLIDAGYHYETRKLYAIPEGYALLPIEPSMQLIADLGFNGDIDLAMGHADISAEIGGEYKRIMLKAANPKLDRGE